MVFSSGYSANVGTIAAIVGKRDLVLNDQYNHSSLRSGAALSGATCLDYQHCNLSDLRQTLTNHRDRFAKCLILTDSVFSMDGDLAPLSELLDLADEFDCMMLVDEAHATGVLGESGAGGLELCGCTGRSVIHMGTLSKALASLGGYVAGSAALIDFFAQPCAELDLYHCAISRRYRCRPSCLAGDPNRTRSQNSTLGKYSIFPARTPIAKHPNPSIRFGYCLSADENRHGRPRG